MGIKTGNEIYLQGLDVIEANKKGNYDMGTTKDRINFEKKKWIAEEKVCSNCGQETLKCNCIDVGTKNRREQIDRLRKDIKDLAQKLLFTATKSVKPEHHEGNNIAETQRKKDVREIRNLLKDKLLTYQIIKEVVEVSEEKWQEK